MNESTALITNDAVVFGLLMVLLGIVFKTNASSHPFWKKIYGIFPSVLVCYFLPSVFNSLGIIDGNNSKLYFVASRYMLPAALVLLTLSTNFKEIKKLGSKAIIMFLTGTLGIVIGGPIALLVMGWIAPDVIGASAEDVWRGMTTVAGSWIGGSANQAAMKEVFEVGDVIFSKMVTVDILVANVWMAIILIGAGKSKMVDKIFKADASAIDEVKTRIEEYSASIAKMPTLTDFMTILAIGSGATGMAHLLSDIIAPYLATNYPELATYSLTSGFFWIVVIATAIGLSLSFTKYRNLEGVGSTRVGSAFIYVIIATIGMHMDVMAIFESPGLFLVGIIWMLVHVILLLGVAKLIRAPFFFVAVGSQANVGGAASAPVVAAAFHPSLAPVGVLLAVLGYTLGTYAAYLCGLLMQAASVN
ncbi:DUF819 domain-containing protein [Reichenbachiella sp.]|uniref:DUF819 family protein n=1 Tax=Reichenbachiella sp. TaxID=2184521 RepID=UPI003B5B0EB6